LPMKGKKMNESNTQTEKPKDERQYSQKQFELLNSCNAEKNMSVWNHWREENPHEAVLLEGASLWHAYLKGVDLRGANLVRADLRGANLEGAKLQSAILWEANLQEANFRKAFLQRAKFMRTHLGGAEFGKARLQHTDFSRAIVDGGTLIWDCQVNSMTKFEGVALGSARIYPDIRQLLEYNIRRINWEEWYTKQHWLVAWLVSKFWQISDYGISTRGIIKTFFKWAIVFAIVYYAWGLIDYRFIDNKDYPGIVSNLFVLEDSKQAVSSWLVPLRAVYFSIVTMTTLGFGDMYANAHSLIRGIFGHILLALQVILGYVLLGALVTRFAVLFTAGGPAGKFADEKEDKKK